MKKIQFIVGLFAAALLVASCSEDYDHHNLSNKPITFTPTIESCDWNAGETRGTLFTGTSFGNNDVFGVSAYRYDGTTLTAATAPANFMYKTQISRTMEKWRTYEEYYWPADGDLLDFYAYYPYNNNNVVPKSQDTPGPMQIVYTVNSNPLQQVDLITAHAKGCSFDNSSSQPLSFSHQLTAVNLVLGDNVAPGYIKSISFEHIATQGTLTVGTGWSEKNDATFTLDMKAYYDSTNGFKTTDNDNNIVTGDAANLTAQTTTLLMIPQTFGNTTQKLKVAFVNEDHPEGVELTTILTDPWVAGSTLTYQISTSDINVLKIAEIRYPSTDTWGNAYIRSSYLDNEEVGLYAIDAQGNVQVDNVKLTRTNGAWVDINGSTPLYAPNLRWFMYYPYKTAGLAHSGKKNNVTVNTAEDFFEAGISDWTPNFDQHTLNDFLAQDLQVATGVQTQASTFSFVMNHKMGVLHMTVAEAGTADDIVYYDGNEGVNSTTEVTHSGETRTYTPSRDFTGNIPYRVNNSNFYLFIAKPGSLTMSASHSDVYDAWSVTGGTTTSASFTETVEANKYVAHTVEHTYVKRGYVKRGWTYAYSGSPKTFVAPVAGTYTFECWGAQGQDGDAGYSGWAGKGGYAKGNITLNTTDSYYVYVGQSGQNYTGGWNGGGTGRLYQQQGYGGGGATDIRVTYNTDCLNIPSLKSRIIVAGGGGGASGRSGGGGGVNGIDGWDSSRPGTAKDDWAGYYSATGGKQDDYGRPGDSNGNVGDNRPQAEYDVNNGAFGMGGNASYNLCGGSGGGGGWYGGGASIRGHGGSGGGSGFIAGHSGCKAPTDMTGNTVSHRDDAIHPSGKNFLSGTTQMISADRTTSMPAPNGGTEIGHSGNGYARIRQAFIE